MFTITSREFENAVQEKRVALGAAHRAAGGKIDAAFIAEMDEKATRLVRRHFVYKTLPGNQRVLVRK